MHNFMNRLIERSIAHSQTLRVSKFQLKNEWSPDIVISRDPGSGGQIIAKKIAKKLGWQLFNKKLMLELSQELHIPESELAHIDEHSRSWFADIIQSIFNPNYVSDVRYINYLKKILLHAAKTGNMVILGRGANLVIPEDKCLRVRVTASFKTRVENTYKFENMKSKEGAAELIRHVESNRNRFIRQYFGVNPNNPWNYDLVISTEHLSNDQVAELIIEAFKTKFPKEGKKLPTNL